MKKAFSLLLVISLVLSLALVAHATTGGNLTENADTTSEDAAASGSDVAEVTTAPSPNTLTYSGEAQALVTAGLANNGTMVYSLVENEEYTTDIPTATNAGDYIVYYYAQGADGYADSEVESVTVTIQKADAIIVKAPVANVLTYNGTYQELIIPGEATGGVMMYNHLNKFDRGFSAAIPTGNMGYYDVWYYVKGDDNHNNSEKFKVGVTIEKAVIEGPIDVEITAPVAGATPQASIYHDLYFAQIRWSPSDTVFGADMEYSAGVSIEPKTSRAYRFDTAETEKFIAKMRADGWTVYGDEDSISMSKTFSTKVKTKVSVTAQNQSIVFGQTIIGNAYYFSSENTAIHVTAKLIPSTENVTVNGTIMLSDVVVTEDGNDITADCELTLNPGKLTITPDVSKIENLTAGNVTSASVADIEAVQNMMASAETEGIDEETKNSWDEITNTCQELLAQIEKVQAEMARIEESMKAYDPAFVTSADESAVTALSADIAALLETQNLTAEERAKLESAQAEADALLAAIDAARTALQTENIESTDEITAENVECEDRAALEAALDDLKMASEMYAGNYTESELKSIEEEMQRIEDAIALLDQVGEVTDQINSLPETVDPDDQETVDKVNEANNAYNDLTDHGKTLINEDVKKKLDDLLAPSEEETYVPVYRLYNPYTNEHLLTSDKAERDFLLEIGWTLDGIAWNAPESGLPVYRLYNPYDDWHTYSVNHEEIEILTALGWTVDGVVTVSAPAENGRPIYRLFNPYEQRNYHLFTADPAERDFLVSLGWKLDGVAWYAAV